MYQLHLEYAPAAVDVLVLDLTGQPVEVNRCRTEPEITAAVARLEVKYGIRPPGWSDPACGAMLAAGSRASFVTHSSEDRRGVRLEPE